MSNGSAHQSAWSDQHHNGAAIDWEDRIAAYDTMGAGTHLSQSDFGGGVSWSRGRADRAEQAWLSRVIKALDL